MTAHLGANAVAFVNAAATKGTDANTQARVFQAGTKALTEIPDWQSGRPPLGAPLAGEPVYGAKPLLGALTSLLDPKDPSKIMAALQGQDPHGQALTTYAQAMLGSGNTRPLSQLFEKLMFGPNPNKFGPNPNKNYGDDPNGDYQNAQSLGYFVGTLQEAMTRNGNTSAAYTVFQGALAGLETTGPEVGLPAAALSTWLTWAKGIKDAQSLSQQGGLYEAALQAISPSGHITPAQSYAINLFSGAYDKVVPRVA